MKPFVLLAIVTVAWSSVASSQDEPKATDLRLEKSFVYSDLVVEGVVEKIATQVVPSEYYAPGVPGPNIPVAVIMFKVNRVLLGYRQPERIEIIARKWGSSGHYCFDLQEGDRYILNLRYANTGKLFEPGKYFIRDDSRKIFIENSDWIQGSKNRPMAKGILPDLYAAIEKAAEERSLNSLVCRADLIASGKVVETRSDNDLTDDGGKPIQRVRLAIEAIIGGEVRGDSLVISIANVGPNESFQSIGLPDMHIGEEWIVFLKHAEELGYYPYAGVNGLFMIKGEALIRNNNNQLVTGYSPRQLELEIEKILAAGE